MVKHRRSLRDDENGMKHLPTVNNKNKIVSRKKK